MSTPTLVEYVWVDGHGSVRSKTKVVQNLKDISQIACWNFDGSSTMQAVTSNSEIILKPVLIVKDPFRKPNGHIALCQTYNNDLTPARFNYRQICKRISQACKTSRPMFGLEQQFYFLDKKGFILNYMPGYRFREGLNYCGVGHHSHKMRLILDQLIQHCIYSGIKITGINSQVSESQWQYQIAICQGVQVGDHLILSRYFLYRISQQHELFVTFKPKPVENKQMSGSGCHINFSCEESRKQEGLTWLIQQALPRLMKNHQSHLKCYGKENQKRLTGFNQTASYKEFRYGIGDRTASVRIPNDTAVNKKGYIEDRRPGANIDPYLACGIMMDTVLLDSSFQKQMLSIHQSWQKEEIH